MRVDFRFACMDAVGSNGLLLARRVVFVPSFGWFKGPDGEKSRRVLRLYAKRLRLQLDATRQAQPDVMVKTSRCRCVRQRSER